MAHGRSKTFRPVDVGALQRLTHWALAAAGLVSFVALGIPGLSTYFLGLLLLFGRLAGRDSIMDYLVRARDDAVALEWKGVVGGTGRKAMSLAGRRPHRLLAGAVLVASLALMGVLGARVGDDLTTTGAIALRAGIAVAAWAILGFALFGFFRRTTLVFGTDGIRVGQTFVSYSTMTRFKRQGNDVAIERSVPSPPIVIETVDAETAARLVHVLTWEWERARQRRAQPSQPLPPAGFRENASQVGWRVRVLDSSSDEERRAAIARVPPEDLRELLDETADPSLEEELQGRLRRSM